MSFDVDLLLPQFHWFEVVRQIWCEKANEHDHGVDVAGSPPLPQKQKIRGAPEEVDEEVRMYAWP